MSEQPHDMAWMRDPEQRAEHYLHAAIEHKERALHLVEALQQVTYYHHDDYQYCSACERALRTFGLLPLFMQEPPC